MLKNLFTNATKAKIEAAKILSRTEYKNESYEYVLAMLMNGRY